MIADKKYNIVSSPRVTEVFLKGRKLIHIYIYIYIYIYIHIFYLFFIILYISILVHNYKNYKTKRDKLLCHENIY